jgi:membrane protein
LGRFLYIIAIINLIISYVLIKNILVSVSDEVGTKYLAIYLSNIFLDNPDDGICKKTD